MSGFACRYRMAATAPASLHTTDRPSVDRTHGLASAQVTHAGPRYRLAVLSAAAKLALLDEREVKGVERQRARAAKLQASASLRRKSAASLFLCAVAITLFLDIDAISIFGFCRDMNLAVSCLKARTHMHHMSLE